MWVRTFRKFILPTSSGFMRCKMLVHKYQSTQRRNTADYKMNRLGAVNLKYGDCNPIKDGISVKGLSLNSSARHEYVTAVFAQDPGLLGNGDESLCEYLPTFRSAIVPSSAGLKSPFLGNTTIIFVTFFSLFLIKFPRNDKYLLHTATANSPSECEGIPPI